jgi:GMP synthase-like glutamine amidotransferase
VSKLIQACVNGQRYARGKAYFFFGSTWCTYDWADDRVTSGGAAPAGWGLTGARARKLDAALDGAGPYAGKTYFFLGDDYVRYHWGATGDDASGGIDQEPANTVAAWNLPADFAGGIDAALAGAGNYADYAYFFKGNRYARYGWNDQSVYTGTLDAWKLPGDFVDGIDAALAGSGQYAGFAYFFKDNRYVKYDWAKETVVGGPSPIRDGWPGVMDEVVDPSSGERRLVLMVTIDERDYFITGEAGNHQPNFQRLHDVAQKSQKITDHVWHGDLTQAKLDDPSLLALFLAGSWPEWIELRTNPDWKASLDRFAPLMRETTVPILAVCGSHQLIAAIFADWNAIGHMVEKSADHAPPAIADELADGTSRIPERRIGEVGAFPVRMNDDQQDDPLFAGLIGPMYFMEHHHDQVLASGRSADFVSLVHPAPEEAAVQDLSEHGSYKHVPVNDAADRCQVQALRYDSSARVLYTTQFHPELPCASVAGEVGDEKTTYKASWEKTDRDGERVLRNFFQIAERYWKGGA